MERTSRFRVEQEDITFLNPLPGWQGGITFIVFVVLSATLCLYLGRGFEEHEKFAIEIYVLVIHLGLAAFAFSATVSALARFLAVVSLSFGPLCVYLLFIRTTFLITVVFASLLLMIVMLLPSEESGFQIISLRIILVAWSSLTIFYRLGCYFNIIDAKTLGFAELLEKISFMRQALGTGFAVLLLIWALIRTASMPFPAIPRPLGRPDYRRVRPGRLAASFWEPFSWLAHVSLLAFTKLVNFVWQLVVISLTYLRRAGEEIARILWVTVFSDAIWKSFCKSLCTIVLVTFLILRIPSLEAHASHYLRSTGLADFQDFMALVWGYFFHSAAIAVLCSIWTHNRYRSVVYRCQVGASFIFIGFGISGLLLVACCKFGIFLLPGFAMPGPLSLTVVAVLLLAIAYQTFQNVQHHEA